VPARVVPATGDRTAPMLFSGRLKRRFNSRDTVTETALHVVTPLPWPIEAASMSATSPCVLPLSRGWCTDTFPRP